MAYFNDDQIEKVTLNSNPDYWVDLLTNLAWGDMKKLLNTSKEGEASYEVDAMLLACIKGWNLDDKDGNVLPITQENLDKLQRPDIEQLVTVLGAKIEESKSSKKAS